MTKRFGSESLVVVVEHTLRAALTGVLQERGYTVTGTSSFHEARQELEHSPPQVLISDIRLGAFNGLHLALLARHARVAETILLDDKFDSVLESDARRFYALYLVKPIDLVELTGHVSRMVGRAAPTAWAPSPGLGRSVLQSRLNQH